MDGLKFGALLSELRGSVSQEALAVRAGSSQSYVSRVEGGHVQPTLAQAEHLLSCLGYKLQVRPEPMSRRTDPYGLPAQLAMTAEERMLSAAALHNTMVDLRGDGPR